MAGEMGEEMGYVGRRDAGGRAVASASAEGGRAEGGDRVRLREGRVPVTGCKTGDWVLCFARLKVLDGLAT